MEQNTEEENKSVQTTNVVSPAHVVISPAANKIAEDDTIYAKVRHATAWTLIVTAACFAFIGVLAVWNFFGPNSDAVGKAFASLAIIGFATLIVNLGSRLAEKRS